MSRNRRGKPVRRIGLLLFLSVVLLGAGCGDGPSGEGASAIRPALTVLAASSLEPVLTSLEAAIEVEVGIDLQTSFSSSSAAARQVVEGAPADLLITADGTSMKIATDEEVVESPDLIARNYLALIVGAGNPERVQGLADLARSDLGVVLCDPEVPCGRLAKALLDDRGITPIPDSLEENVSAAVGKVELGEGDLTIGYVTDVKARFGRVEQVAAGATESDEFAARYLAAVVRASPARASARRLIEFLRSPTAQSRLAEAGFVGVDR